MARRLPSSLKASSLPWVSAGETRNYALNDPLCDYLAQEAQRTGEQVTPGPFVQYLMRSGQEFEHKVIAELGRRLGSEHVKQVVLKASGHSGADDTQKLTWYRETLRLMHEGVPIIYQGFLLDDEKRIYGVPDLLVRSDFLRRLVTVNPLPGSESERYYVVVEIKWTTLLFCADQLHLRNGGSITAFKTQVALYHHCLEKVQKSGRSLAFILGKRSKDPHGPVTDDCFYRLARVDFAGKDASYLHRAHEAVRWLQALRKEGSTWTLYPRPSRVELYPNMKNYNDDPWREKKRVIADRLREITLVWQCKHTNRLACFRKGIFSWDDPRCTPENMGVKGRIITPIIRRILEVNRSTATWILPTTLDSGPQGSELTGGSRTWLEYRKGDFYLDFEFISMLDNGLEHFPAANVTGLVYLIGTGYYDANMHWQYKCFLADRLTPEEERRIFQEWIAFVREKAQALGVTMPRLLHWGTAEDTWFGRHTDKFPESARKTLNFSFVNVLEEIKRYPIVVRGTFGFGLKEFGTALYKLGKIRVHWPELDSGLETITHIMSLQEQAVRRAGRIADCEGAVRLQSYNETDCRMVAEILGVLRTYYSQEEEVIPARKRRLVVTDDSEDDIPLSELLRRRKVALEPIEDASVEVPMTELLHAQKRRSRSPLEETSPESDFIVSDAGESDLERLTELGREQDRRRMRTVLSALEGQRETMSRFQREHVLEQLRVLCQTQEQTAEFFSLLNYLQYYTRVHPSLDPAYYPEAQRGTVTALAQLQKERQLGFPEVLAAPLPLEQKFELYEKLLTLETLAPFSEAWFDLRNSIYRAVADARALTEEQRTVLALTVEEGNYLNRIAESSFPVGTKAYLVAKYRKAVALAKDDSERHTEFRILDYALSLPWGRRAPRVTPEQLSEKLLEGKRYLDDHVYGMVALKEQFLIQIIEDLREESSRGRIIGICGSPGIGKSTFANAVGVASGRPVYRINMGGISDLGMLIGNLPTWVGADIGLLTRALITSKREDIVLVLEEIDKISPTHYGEEITHFLAHVLDPAFNDQITDKFLGVAYSLRHVTFVATFNEADAIPPVIRNRIRVFRLPDPTPQEKLEACMGIILRELYRSYKFRPEELIIERETVELLISRTSEDKGLRSLQNHLVSLFSKIHAIREVGPEIGAKIFSFYQPLTFPLTVTPRLVARLLKDELKTVEPGEWRTCYA